MVAVIPRSEWGARHEDGGGSAPVPFTEWWLHHTVTIAPDLVPPFDDEYRAMRILEDIGEQRFGRGISYTWLVMPNGRVYQGHSVNRLGAHTGGRNSAARAICLVGNYDVARVTSAQIESAAQLLVQEHRAGRATRYTLNGGHRQLKATSCPGNNGFAAIPTINARAAALMRGAPAQEEDDMFTEEDRKWLAGAFAYIFSAIEGKTHPDGRTTLLAKNLHLAPGEGLTRAVAAAEAAAQALAGGGAAAAAGPIDLDRLADLVVEKLGTKLQD